MIIIEPSYMIESDEAYSYDKVLLKIERVGRTCYRSTGGESENTVERATKFIAGLRREDIMIYKANKK